MKTTTGSLIEYRKRDWIVIPSEKENVLMLRPISGGNRELCGVYLPLQIELAKKFEHEKIKESTFPLPNADKPGSLDTSKLTVQAIKVLLREAATPFRSFGQISIRPRPYQLVPLIMALKQSIVRLLIADDVGVGKTVEAGLIARELWDRGEINRIAVLCPPYLCEQWKEELSTKFGLDAVVIRAGTIARLERLVPTGKSVFEHHSCFVASIDLIKGEKYRYAFQQFCPDFLIVDEAHGAAFSQSKKSAKSQQQRHELLQLLAKKQSRHLVLVTATPHSGVEGAFLSLLGLLNPEFRELNLSSLTDTQRKHLANYFMQRRRGDVKKWLDEETPFPERDTTERENPYSFTKEYRKFFEDVYNFAYNIYSEGEKLTGFRRRMRFWSALALLRCISSSPAAAEAALSRKKEKSLSNKENMSELFESTDELDTIIKPTVYDLNESESVNDTSPSTSIEFMEDSGDWQEQERRKLSEFAKRATELSSSQYDSKLKVLIEAVKKLIQNGFHPVIWCRYIATANYLYNQLKESFTKGYKDLSIALVTGELPDESRKQKVLELSNSNRRVLVATDCLSEGINLQNAFNSVIHYDLPWNPNRLEQREGRVDRYGQKSKIVKTLLIFGKDNPVDGAVWEVLLKKAYDINRDLGINVPVPMDSENVMEAVIKSLFKGGLYNKKRDDRIQELQFGWVESDENIRRFQEDLDTNVKREKENRTRFAQHAIKPEQVAIELKNTDDILGNPDLVREFSLSAFTVLKVPLNHNKKNDTYSLNLNALPPNLAHRFENPEKSLEWHLSFVSPEPEKSRYIGRNHPLVEGLAEYVVDLAFHPIDKFPISRCSAIRCEDVAIKSTFYFLRFRYLLSYEKESQERLLEEVVAIGYKGRPSKQDTINSEECFKLLSQTLPSGNIDLEEQKRICKEGVDAYSEIQNDINTLFNKREEVILETHKRIRGTLAQSKRIKVKGQKPADLISVVVMLPQPKGVAK